MTGHFLGVRQHGMPFRIAVLDAIPRFFHEMIDQQQLFRVVGLDLSASGAGAQPSHLQIRGRFSRQNDDRNP